MSGTGMQKIQILGFYVLEVHGENMRTNGLIRLVANTRLGVIPLPISI
jgi:hypothetical protein